MIMNVSLIHTNTATQRPAAVTAYFSSKQLLLFVFVRQNNLVSISVELTTWPDTFKNAVDFKGSL